MLPGYVQYSFEPGKKSYACIFVLLEIPHRYEVALATPSSTEVKPKNMNLVVAKFWKKKRAGYGEGVILR